MTPHDHTSAVSRATRCLVARESRAGPRASLGIVSFRDHVVQRLETIRSSGLFRHSRTVGPPGPSISVAGRTALLFCSNDYLGLAGHPRLRRAVQEGAETWGAGAGAARLITGTLPPHESAERHLAALVRRPTALLFPTGYAANLGAVQALVGPDDLVLSDARNHASLIDGCRLSRARTLVYPHGDVERLRELLRTPRAGAALVVTESLFSMDGDLAPLQEIRQACDEAGAGLLVDEAHALGTMGPEGRGACVAAGVVPDLLVGTLGKALGLGGAFVAGEPETVRLVENRARTFVFSTAQPPALAAAVPVAVELAVAAEARRARLHSHASRLRRDLLSLRFRVPAGDSAIVPVLLGTPEAALGASQLLLDAGVLVQAIRPPTVPPGTSRLRVVPSAAHEPADVDRVVAAFERLASADRRFLAEEDPPT